MLALDKRQAVPTTQASTLSRQKEARLPANTMSPPGGTLLIPLLFLVAKVTSQTQGADMGNPNGEKAALEDIGRQVREAHEQLAARKEELLSGVEEPVIRDGISEAYEAALRDVDFHARNSKSFAEKGDPERATNWIKNHIEAAKSNFESNVEDIKGLRSSS